MSFENGEAALENGKAINSAKPSSLGATSVPEASEANKIGTPAVSASEINDTSLARCLASTSKRTFTRARERDRDRGPSASVT